MRIIRSDSDSDSDSHSGISNNGEMEDCHDIDSYETIYENDDADAPVTVTGLHFQESIQRTLKPFTSYPSTLLQLKITGFDISLFPSLTTARHLTKLTLWYAKVTSLTGITLSSTLTSLSCEGNRYLRSLPELPTGLVNLDLPLNGLTSLPKLDMLTDLKFLYCNDNKLSELPCLTSLKNLRLLHCEYNSLTSLIDFPASLKVLGCSNNKLSRLAIGKELNRLHTVICHHNNLFSIEELPASIVTLDVSDNYINHVDWLPSLTELRDLYLANNNLVTLPRLPSSLLHLKISRYDMDILFLDAENLVLSIDTDDSCVKDKKKVC